MLGQPAKDICAHNTVAICYFRMAPRNRRQTKLLADADDTPTKSRGLGNSYTMGCPPVRGDNPRALASGLSYVQVDTHGITFLYHQHQCRSCTSRDISC